MAAFCPILKSSDILEVMRQLEIPIVEEDLAKPQPQRVQMWYEAFLFILKGISLDQLGTNTDIDMVDITDYPETHGDDVFLVSFYIQVAKLMKEVGMEDFTLRDFIKPEKIRIQRILSSICNFAMFRDDRMPILEKYTLKWEQATQRNEKLRAQRTEIEELIEEIKQREAERPDVERTKEENEELRTELKNMISTQTALMEQLNELKGEKETLEEQVTEVNEICDGLKLEITRLRARVVHSPEKIRNAIVELNAQITQTRQQLQDNEVKSRRLASRIELLDGLHQDVIACNRQMEECKEVVEEQEEAMQKLMQGREVVGQIESQINGLNVVKEQLEYKDSNTDLKISRLEGNQEKKREANGERLKKLQQERAQVLDQLEKIRQRVQEKKRYLDELNQKISTEKAKIQEEINQVQGQYDILRRQTFVYQDEINRLLMTFLEKLTEE